MIPITVAAKYEQLPQRRERRAPGWKRPGRLAAGMLLPFSAGYFLSYAFRTINGPVSDKLVAAFHLGPFDLGVLTAVYFLTFAAFQLPAGLLIDRHGPRRVQAGLFVVAAAGAFLFASAQDEATLMLGRALIGLGCSGALVTGVKAISLWRPPERRLASNALLVMSGGLGAIGSAMPIDAISGLEWRTLFDWLGLLTLAVAGAVWWLIPDAPALCGRPQRHTGSGLRRILADRRFWRVAPLSALIVGSTFAIHGLWAARWLADVARLGPTAIAGVLLTMGCGLTAGAVGFGVLAQRLRQRGVTTVQLFAAAAALFMVIEAVIALHVPVTPAAVLGVFASFGAITVLSFTMIGELFPPELIGRANGLLNTLHLGAAFVAQAGIGAIVALWPTLPDGHVPAPAYGAAIGTLVLMQAAALAWFTAAGRPAGPRVRLIPTP